MTVLEVGEVIPASPRRRVQAVAAGVLWLLALALLASYPARARVGILEQQTGSGGISYGLASLRLVGACGLLAVAHVLSCLAHGKALLLLDEDLVPTRRVVPRVVLVARLLTWAAVLALLVGTAVAESLVSGTDCFRTCAPFPD